MALSNYAELKEAVADWMERADLAPRIPDFIALAEVKFNRLLRARMAEVTASLAGTVGSRSIALPATFVEQRALWRVCDGRSVEVNFVDPALMPVESSPSAPHYWTLDGGSIAFERACDQPYTFSFRYLRKFRLSDAEPTNAILTDHPDLYLFGALQEATPFVRDADLLSLVKTRYDDALQEASNLEDANRNKGRLRTDSAIARLNRGGYDIRTG